MRIALIGTGNWARRYHLPSLAYIRQHKLGGCEITLHGIYGLRQDEAAQLAAQYGFARTYASLQQLIDDGAVDSVSVVVTPEAAKDVILQVAMKDVPIHTEKPPGANYAEAKELAERIGVTNVVSFNRKYGVLNNRFKQLIEKTPNILKVRGVMYRRNRTEPHFVLHTGIHLVSLMEHLFGPIHTLHRQRAGTGEFLSQVQFASGLSGEILFAPCSDQHYEGVEVHTADRVLVLQSPHTDAPGEILLRTPTNHDQMIDRSDQIPILEEGYAWAHVDLLTAARTGGATRSNFANAVNIMRVAEAIEAGRELSL